MAEWIIVIKAGLKSSIRPRFWEFLFTPESRLQICPLYISGHKPTANSTSQPDLNIGVSPGALAAWTQLLNLIKGEWSWSRLEFCKGWFSEKVVPKPKPGAGHITPSKINIEPENGGLVQMIFLWQMVYSQAPCESCGVYVCTSMLSTFSTWKVIVSGLRCCGSSKHACWFTGS